MISREDVQKVLAFCAAHDPTHFPKPSFSIVEAWLTQSSKWPHLVCNDLIAAADKYYEQPDRNVPQPGDILSVARSMRRDVLDRMDPDERAQVVGGADTPRDRYGYIDKTEEGAAERALAVVPTSYRWETGDREENDRGAAEEALPRGTYIAADPAGWTYGMPSSPGSPDYDPAEKKTLRTELDARIRVYRKTHPDATDTGAGGVEYEIRVGDRARSVKFLHNIKRGDLAGMFGDLPADSGDDPDVIDAEVVDLDSGLDAAPIPATVGSGLHTTDDDGGLF